MTTLTRDTGELARKVMGIVPWAAGAIILLYAMGYVDGSVHAAALVCHLLTWGLMAVGFAYLLRQDRGSEHG